MSNEIRQRYKRNKIEIKFVIARIFVIKNQWRSSIRHCSGLLRMITCSQRHYKKHACHNFSNSLWGYFFQCCTDECFRDFSHCLLFLQCLFEIGDAGNFHSGGWGAAFHKFDFIYANSTRQFIADNHNLILFNRVYPVK